MLSQRFEMRWGQRALTRWTRSFSAPKTERLRAQRDHARALLRAALRIDRRAHSRHARGTTLRTPARTTSYSQRIIVQPSAAL